MPFRESGQGGGRKKRREDEQANRGGRNPRRVSTNPQDPVGAYPVPSQDQSISTVERASYGTLPTRLVLDVAGLGLDDRDLVRFAKRLARDYDVPPKYIFGDTDPKSYVNPVTGLPLTMRDINRTTAYFEPVAIAAMLAQQTQGTTVPTEVLARRGGGYTPEADPAKVAKHARILAQNFPGIDWTQGVALAAALTRRGISPKQFADNIGAIKGFLRDTNTRLDAGSVVGTAISIGSKKLRDSHDVHAALMFGEEGKALINRAREREDEVRDKLAALRREEAEPVRYGTGKVAESRARGEVLNLYTDDLQGLAITAPDLWAEVQEIAGNVQAEQEAFSNSFVGKALSVVGDGLNDLWNATQVTLVELGTDLITVPVLLGSALGLDAQGDSIRENFDALRAQRTYATMRINRGDSVGDFVQEGFDLPTWTAPAFDFAIGWYVDPFVGIGKFGRVLRGADPIYGGTKFVRAGRVAQRLEEPLSFVETVSSKVPGLRLVVTQRKAAIKEALEAGWYKYATEVLPDAPVADQLYKALYKGNTRWLETLDNVAPGRIETRTLDPEFMKLTRSKMLERFPTPTAEAREEFGNILRAHTLGYAPDGTLAAEVVAARIGGERLAVRTAREADDLGEGAVEELAARTIGDNHFFGFTREGPSQLGLWGPRRATRRAISSQAVTATRPGRRLAALPNINHGRVLNPHDNPGQYVLSHARRWSTFDERTVRKFQSMADEISSQGGRWVTLPNGNRQFHGLERALMDLVDEINDEAFEAIIKPYNLSDDARKTLEDMVFGHVRTMNKRQQVTLALGEGDDLRKLTDPLLETQLRNTILVADPVQVRHVVRTYTGFGRRAKAHLKSALGKNAPEIANAADPAALQRRLDEGFRALGRDYRRLWKGLTVARPGYIPRVILTDENARFLITTRSLTERLLAQRWWGLTNKLDNFGVERIQVGDDIVDLSLPGVYERNPAASGQIRQAEILEDIVRDARAMHKRLTPTGSWDALVPEGAGIQTHLGAWQHVLSKQFALSRPGRIALESVSAGDDVAATATKLASWARTDGAGIVRSRLGIDPGDIDDWATDLAQGVHQYTMADRRIADAAMQAGGRELRQVLDRTPLDKRPVVHGPVVEGLLGGEVRQGWVDNLYRWMVRNPEDVLNRQPFFKTWKRRAERSMYEEIAAAAKRNPAIARKYKVGTEAKLWSRPADFDTAAQLERAIASQSDEYFYHQTRATPADLMDSGLLPKPPPGGRRWETAKLPAARNKEPRVYLATDPDFTNFLTSQDFTGPMLRVRKSDVAVEQGAFAIGMGDDAIPAEFFSTKAVPAGKIEFFGADGKWHPLSEAEQTFTSALTPEIRAAVDVASTKFALEQVRKVMFDFSKQSRLTELLQFAFPFPQPFFEGFQTWGAIAMRNPEGIGRMMQLFRTGLDTGFIRKDELSGEYVVPMGIYRAIAGPLWALGGRSQADLDKLGLGFVAPLSSFNMLTSSSLKLSHDGLLGKVVGGVPLPVPGMDPLLALLGQQMFANSSNVPVTSYLFQYGPSAVTNILPRSLKVAMQQAGVLKDENTADSLTYAILRAWQVNGLDVDENGNPIPLDELQAMAEEQGRELAELRNFASLFSPAALRPVTSASPYIAEWQELIENSDSYFEAVDTWNERHPDLSYIPIGTTWAGIAFEGPGGEIKAPRLPASAVVGEMLKDPRIGEFMTTNPAWAALLLVGMDPELVEQQDWPTFAKLISANLIQYKPIDRFLEEGQDAKVYREIDVWYRSVWDPQYQQMLDSGQDTSDHVYTELLAKRREFFTFLATQHPDWARHNLQQFGEGEDAYWDWPEGGGQTKPVQLALADARRITDIPGLESFPGIQALQDYLDLRDRIAEKMEKRGYTDIMQSASVEDGLLREYESGVKAILDAQPDMQQYLGTMFGVRLSDDGALTDTYDLRSQPTARQIAFQEMDPETRAAVVKLDSRIEKFRDKALVNVDFDWQRSDRYNEAARILDAAYAKNPEIVQAWWETTADQTGYLDALSTRPPVFWSAWDWHLAAQETKNKNLELTPQAIEWISKAGAMRVQIAKREEADPTYSEGEGYQKLNRWMLERAKEDKTFAAAVKHMDDWTLPFKVAGYDKLPGKTGEAWRKVLDAAAEIQELVRKSDINGVDYGSDDERRWYDSVQDTFITWVNGWKDYAPGFKETWNEFQKRAEGNPIVGNYILPDTYFPISA